jgi:hypothetical protein
MEPPGVATERNQPQIDRPAKPENKPNPLPSVATSRRERQMVSNGFGRARRSA